MALVYKCLWLSPVSKKCFRAVVWGEKFSLERFSMVKNDSSLGVASDSVLTPEYERSVQIVSRMWQDVSNTQGIILTLIEATTTNSEQCDAQKALIKRELNNMGRYIQDAIYEEYGVQDASKSRVKELPFSLHKEEVK